MNYFILNLIEEDQIRTDETTSVIGLQPIAFDHLATSSYM
jgi:hypothetical protein